MTGGTSYAYARSLFTQDKFLFILTGPTVLEELRDMESEFGIVPAPKFDYAEERYYAAVDAWVALLGVTTTAPDLEKTGAVLETMAWESRYTVTPAYQETLLQRKYTRDAESMEMLDIIARSRVYDIMAMMNWGGIAGVGGTKLASKKPVAVSDFEKHIAAAQKAMEEDLAFFAELDN